MSSEVKDLINKAVVNIIHNTGSEDKIKKLEKTHEKKIHFIPKRYRVFGGLLQSMNIQFGNFIEELMSILVANENSYEIIKELSGSKNNKFLLSVSNDTLIDNYISNCQHNALDLDIEFPKLQKAILNDDGENLNAFKHDIDLLFRDKETNKVYYVECKYNDDHDTGKFVDINRKFIKTYAYLVKELSIDNVDDLVPILFFFTNKRLKGNIYIPEDKNIRRGEKFFEEFLSTPYSAVDAYLSDLSESTDNIKNFDDLYKSIMSR